MTDLPLRPDLTVEAMEATQASRDESWPLPQAVGLAIALSLGLWTVIGFGVRWLLA